MSFDPMQPLQLPEYSSKFFPRTDAVIGGVQRPLAPRGLLAMRTESTLLRHLNSPIVAIARKGSRSIADTEGGHLEHLEKSQSMAGKPPSFDERALTPRQRRARQLAQAQGVSPVKKLDELFVVDIPREEAATFDEFLLETRRQSRSLPRKRIFD